MSAKVDQLLTNIQSICQNALGTTNSTTYGNDDDDILKTITESYIRHISAEEMGKYQLEINQYKTEIIELKKQLNDDANALVIAQVKSLELHTANDRIDRLNDEISRHNEKITEMEMKAMTEISTLLRAKSETDQKLTDLNELYLLAVKERQTLMTSSKAIDAAEIKVIELTSQLETVLDNTKNLEMKVIDLTDQLSQAIYNKEIYYNRSIELEKEIQKLTQEEAGVQVIMQSKLLLENKVNRMENELTSLQNQVQNHSRIAAIAVERERVSKENDDIANRKVTAVEAELETMKILLQNNKQYQVQLQAEVDKAIDNSNGVMNERDMYIQELNVCKSGRQAVEVELQQSHSKINDMEEEFVAVMGQLMATREAVLDSSDGAELMMLRQSVKLADDKYNQLDASMNEKIMSLIDENNLLRQQQEQHQQRGQQNGSRNDIVPANRINMFDDSHPVVILTIGSYTTTVSVLTGASSSSDGAFKVVYQCLTIIAYNGNYLSTLDKYTSTAVATSSLSNYTYQMYKDSGIFIGADATYALFHHPDIELKSTLQLLDVIDKRCGSIACDVEKLSLYIKHCMIKSINMDDLSNVQLLVTYKSTIHDDDVLKLPGVVFDYLSATKVAMISEASLYTMLTTTTASGTAVVVDIGAYRTTVSPVYDGILLKHALAATDVGGEDCTMYLERMLNSRINSSNDTSSSTFSSMILRRRLAIARDIKEAHAFVHNDFKHFAGIHGNPIDRRVKVMHLPLDDDASDVHRDVHSTSSVSNTSSSTYNDAYLKSIRITHGVTALEDCFNVSVDVELPYAVEVLFQPSLLSTISSTDGSKKSISDAFLSSIELIDAYARSDICSRIVITGGSAHIPGLADRFASEIKASMAALGVVEYTVEAIDSSDSICSNAYKCIVDGCIDSKIKTMDEYEHEREYTFKACIV